MRSGVRFGTVLADAGYGSSAAFRHAWTRTACALRSASCARRKVYAADVALVPPPGRARKLVPAQDPRTVEAVLDERPWRRVTWRQGTKGKLSARFSALRVRVAMGRSSATTGIFRARRSGWWASGAPRASASTTCPTCRRGSRDEHSSGQSRRAGCASRAHQQLKEELGLDHFEGPLLDRACTATR